MSTQSQQNKINHFKTVTNINNDQIAQIALERFNWDVNVAISSFFENPDSVLQPSQQQQQQRRPQPQIQQQQQEAQQSSIGYYASYIPGLTSFGSLLSSMFSYLTPYLPYFSSIFSMFNTSTSSISYNQIINEFKTKYNKFNNLQNDEIFENIGFGQLMNSQERNKCIFIFFNDINSNLCDSFIKNILYDDEVLCYLRVNMKCWIGDLRNNDGKQLFRQITHDWSSRETRKPFICIAGIHPISSKLVLVHRQYVGNINSSLTFIANILDHGLQRWQTFKLQQIQRQELSQSNRLLIQNTDREYLKELENELMKNNEKEKKEEIINNQLIQKQKEEEKYENKIKNAKKKLNSISSIIENSSKDKLIKVAIKLPNGRRVQHIFCNENIIESIFDFAETNELKINDKYINEFELVCSFPKRIFTKNDYNITLKDAGIEHSAMMYLQEIDDDDD